MADGAQLLSNQRSARAVAALSLVGTARWCVVGRESMAVVENASERMRVSCLLMVAWGDYACIVLIIKCEASSYLVRLCSMTLSYYSRRILYMSQQYSQHSTAHERGLRVAWCCVGEEHSLFVFVCVLFPCDYYYDACQPSVWLVSSFWDVHPSYKEGTRIRLRRRKSAPA